MFIPLYERIPLQKFPLATFVITFICCWCYVMTSIVDGSNFSYYLQHYGFTPYFLTKSPGPLTFFTSHLFFTPITSIFVHAGFFHILMNLWMLNIVGKRVESALGVIWFIVLYFTAGLVASFTQYMALPFEIRPIVGASGAIAGIMGAYLRLFPRRRIVCLVFLWLVELPAYTVLGFWLLQQIMNVVVDAGGGVAWWAHIGGFFVGFFLAGKWDRRGPRTIDRVVIVRTL